MPKKNKYPRLHTRTKKGKAGQVYTYYTYDMRPEGKPDINLGSDRLAAIEKWQELQGQAVNIRGRLQEAFTRWREQELPAYDSPVTRRNYALHLKRLEPVFGMATWDEITVPVLRQYLDKRTAKTQGNREISVLSIIWTKARLWGMTDRPWPAAGMKGWKNKEKAREFEVTDDLFDAVYEHADRILRGCMDIATATGMRITDAILVQRPRGGVLRHQHHKTGKWVEFDITQSPVLTTLTQERDRIPSACNALLVTDKGEAITYAMLHKRWLNAQQAAAQAHPGKAADIQRMYLRDMRKRAADLADGLDEAAQLLQHSSKFVTQKHYRTKATKLKAVR